MTTVAYQKSLEDRLLEQAAGPLGYRAITDGLRIGACGDADFLRRRFLAHFDAGTLADVPDDRVAVVTGFGPTNAPTLGTLSAMLATCELQRRSRLHTTIVVSDLGAWNSRNLRWQHLEEHRDRMLAFLEAIGFDTQRGVLRTHQDEANLILSGRIARFLTEQDFLANREVLDDLYRDLGVRGPQLGVMVDGLYTIADIVGPLAAGRERVVMLAGIEEHYFTELSRLLLARCDEDIPGELFASGSRVAALFLRVVPGLGGHDKMSKSIPASAVRLSEPAADIRCKIVDTGATDDGVVLRMMELASTWEPGQLAEVRHRFDARTRDRRPWLAAKREYAEHVIGFAETWGDVTR
ncbi:MAG TPA: hypothetical protein VIL48_03250 [Acidimicrobiales bacterium]